MNADALLCNATRIAHLYYSECVLRPSVPPDNFADNFMAAAINIAGAVMRSIINIRAES